MTRRDEDRKLALRRVLHELAEQEIPDVNLMPKMNGGFSAAKRHPRPALMLVKIALAMFGLLVATAGAYAIVQTLRGGDPGLEAMNEADRITYFNDTKMVEPENTFLEGYEFAVTLDYGYADANRITISYTVEASADEPFQLYTNPSLSDAAGTVFPFLPLGGGGGGGGGGSEPQTRYTMSSEQTSNFDATGITDAPESLDLMLVIDMAVTPLNEDGSPRADMEGGMGMLLGGRTTFDITLPFNPGRVYDSAQTVTHDMLDVTLSKVVVAPSLTRIELCYTDPEPAETIWTVYGTLTLDGETLLEGQLLAGYASVSEAMELEPCRDIIVPQALDDRSGAWVLTIERFGLTDSEDRDAVAQRLREEYGVDVQAAEGGGYVINALSGLSDAEMNAAFTKVIGEEQESIVGPWVFEWAM